MTKSILLEISSNQKTIILEYWDSSIFSDLLKNDLPISTTSTHSIMIDFSFENWSSSIMAELAEMLELTPTLLYWNEHQPRREISFKIQATKALYTGLPQHFR